MDRYIDARALHAFSPSRVSCVHGRCKAASEARRKHLLKVKNRPYSRTPQSFVVCWAAGKCVFKPYVWVRLLSLILSHIRQVYSLLGKLDLLLKRREGVLRAYHREAEEGAREARALLASAASQHDPNHAWGVSRPPNIRQLIGGREG